MRQVAPIARVTRLVPALSLLAVACGGHVPSPQPAPAAAHAAAGVGTSPDLGAPAMPPRTQRVDPTAGGGASRAPGFVALEDELRRAMSELGKKSDPAPYFIGYEVHDRREVTIGAADGALTHSTDHRARVLGADVRVGDYKLDSSHTLRAGDFDFTSLLGGGGVALPVEDSAPAIRAVAWSETDKRYKAAVERLTKIRAQKKVKVAEDDQSDDFSRETPVQFVEAPASAEVDVAAWEARVRRLSARFRAAPEINQGQATLQVVSLNRWLTNSEGSSIQTGRNYVRVFLQAHTRADDGMELQRYETFDAASFAALPSEDAMMKAADAIVTDLRALRQAPLAEPFAGPAILEGKAAGVFFHEIFGHRIEGHRQKKEDEGQTFAKKVGEAVMPSFISVYDDPALARIGEEDLNGFYRFDDEAVVAQRASLVEGGVLKGFLMGRSPTRGFTRSNGHGRRQERRSAVARQGNLVVQPSLAISTDQLRKRLREEAQRQGKPYGLLFKDISGGFTNTGRRGPQAFKVLPILVYRVFTDGRPDELVRGADLVGTPLTSLGKILAAADDYQTFNGFCGAESGWVPVSATSPSLLLQQLEVERQQKGDDKPPILAPPDLSAAGVPQASDDAAVRRALEDELKRTMGLRLGEEAAPYYASYEVADMDVLQVGATFGALTGENRNRVRLLRTDLRVGSPAFDNGNFAAGGFSFLAAGGLGWLALEDDYTALRRTLWLSTDGAYKNALETLAKKKAAATGQAADDADKIPDFAAQSPAQTAAAKPIVAPDAPSLRELTTRLSAIFQGFPAIATSRVNASHFTNRSRFLSSEGTWADQMQAFVRIDVSAETQAEDGMRLRDHVSFDAASLVGLPTYPEMERAVRGMAEELAALKKAPQIENTNGVVLFEGRAAGQIVKLLLADHLSGTPASRTAGNETRGRESASELTGKIGQSIASASLSAYDDPKQMAGPGKEILFGSYQADDEGVPAQKVTVIEGGVLKSLLMSRTPSKEISRSNGHGRVSRFGSARGHAANLFVSVKGGLSRQALLDRMAKEAKEGKSDAFVARLLDDPSALGLPDPDDPDSFMVFFGGGGRGGPPPLRPLIAYRLKDGKEELVRGLSLEGLVPKALKDIVAGGKDATVLNFVDGVGGSGTPTSIVTPALLFKNVEVRKQTGRNKKPPLYPHPSFAEAK